MSEQTLPIVPVTAQSPRFVWRHSLLFNLLLASAASVVLISALLFFAIDHFVSQRFADLGSERLAHAEQQVRVAVAREQDGLRNLAVLLSKDAELNNATYYHVYLEGEIEHPIAAVRRIAASFHLDAVRLWGVDARLLAAAPLASPAITPPIDLEQAHARLIRVEGQPWLMAAVPLTRAGNTLAMLWLGRPLSSVLATTFPAGGGVSVQLAAATGGNRMRLGEAGDEQVWLDLRIDDSVGRALAAVKRLLLWMLPASGLLLAILLGLALRRQLQPLGRLTQAVGAVGRGELVRVEDAGGENEVARLVGAFNAMTADLARVRALERQLQQQERLSAIGRMAARVAHDINNPLSVIRGVAELQARQSERSADQAGLADSQLVLHHTERCMRTVEQLLAYGRPVRLKQAGLDLNVAIADMVQHWQGQHPDHGLVFIAAAQPLVCEVDTYQLERVLDNLLDNARQAAPLGTIQVRLQAVAGWAEVQVADQGPGFPPQAREHLFEPFHTTKPGGTGLGLASCLTIVQAHAGEMSVGDGPGGVVRLRLPLQAQRAG